MERLADDAKAIAERMKQLARDETPAIYRLDTMYGTDLDAVGVWYDCPRVPPSETDYTYRGRLKTHVGVA
jgi:hypothetical protein